MFTGYPVHTRVERHGNHRNRAAPRTASSLVFVSKGISNPDQTIEAGDVNISGVDFWHAVEFSRNGRFLRTAFQRALRALRSFMSSLSDVFRSVFRGFVIQLAGVFCGLTPRPTFQTLADPRSEKRIQLSPTAIR